jgi:hypothetical protein
MRTPSTGASSLPLVTAAVTVGARFPLPGNQTSGLMLGMFSGGRGSIASAREFSACETLGSASRAAVADLVVVVCAHDQQRAQATVLGSGERPGEEDEAFAGEVVHERGVIGHVRLRGDSVVAPARPRVADDGEVAHRAHAMR